MFGVKNNRISVEKIIDLLELNLESGKSSLKQFNFDTSYRSLSVEELDHLLLEILEKIDQGFSVSGQKRATDWEKGWSENRNLFEESEFNTGNLKPKYYRPNNFFRWEGKYIYSENSNLEFEIFEILREIIFHEFLLPTDTVFEFGCGSAHNLVALSKKFPNASLIGCDWASSAIEILNALEKESGLNIEGKLFDFFDPDLKLNVPADSVFVTIGGLEQVGENFDNFLEFALSKDPRLCIHIEPISEFYDTSVHGLTDYLALKFHKSRNYLKGFLTALQILEKDGSIRIIKSKRFPFGGKFHEGWSVIVWEPANTMISGDLAKNLD